jgi:hypothetical protein
MHPYEVIEIEKLGSLLKIISGNKHHMASFNVTKQMDHNIWEITWFEASSVQDRLLIDVSCSECEQYSFFADF